MQSNINIKVRKIIAAHLGVDPTRVTDEARFRDDLGADWLDRLEVMIAIDRTRQPLHDDVEEWVERHERSVFGIGHELPP